MRKGAPILRVVSNMPVWVKIRTVAQARPRRFYKSPSDGYFLSLPPESLSL
ncbi:hypothetical protein BV25DRAFT_1922376 [Artomyces pyxidatus]|uniref:Uncharacterized protein n=1 Tax=Artomyces pyxidatus TaxID=48021 RepID=A0ACB8SEX4_9AGAM|nr:hypothetical protein BV25DRAFT_1922376 [Artomyces pyxidatus]